MNHAEIQPLFQRIFFRNTQGIQKNIYIENFITYVHIITVKMIENLWGKIILICTCIMT